MRPRTEYHPSLRRFVAYDADSYDGAPDASAHDRCLGVGLTEEEALADLTNQLEAYDD